MGIPFELSEDMMMIYDMMIIFTNFVKYLYVKWFIVKSINFINHLTILTYFSNPIGVDYTLNEIEWSLCNDSSLTYLNINTTSDVKTNPKKYSQVKDLYEEYLQPPLLGFWMWNEQ